jgi:hypothetical protein
MVDSIKKDTKLYISEEDVTSELDKTAYEALTWVEIGRVIGEPAFGFDTNMVDLPYVTTTVQKKAKGFSTAATGELTVGVDHDDLGQIELLEAGAPDYTFGRGFKLESNDKLNATGTNTIRYSYGKVAGPNLNSGGGEDRDVDTYSVGLEQAPIIDKATAGA